MLTTPPKPPPSAFQNHRHGQLQRAEYDRLGYVSTHQSSLILWTSNILAIHSNHTPTCSQSWRHPVASQTPQSRIDSALPQSRGLSVVFDPLMIPMTWPMGLPGTIEGTSRSARARWSTTALKFYAFIPSSRARVERRLVSRYLPPSLPIINIRPQGYIQSGSVPVRSFIISTTHDRVTTCQASSISQIVSACTPPPLSLLSPRVV